MSKYPRGSEWRRWDFHVHCPGNKLSDGYTKKGKAPDLEHFCEVVHQSGVAVIAVTDYFSLDGFFAVKDTYNKMYPHADTLLLPNLELRLPLAVNKDHQEVNLHLVFRPTLTRQEAHKFLSHLDTEATTGTNRSKVTCADLDSQASFESATVTTRAIEDAIKATFGEFAITPLNRREHLIVVASAKGDGIRASGSGIARKMLLADEIDKFADAFYASMGSRDYFLDTDRLETNESIAPKPVFDGCDAHSFADLESSLGKQVKTEGSQRNITWIKADPTYHGLLQTLIEPAERVAMQANEPDQKEPYKVISKVKFEDTTDFPSEVLFNRNLNAVIGSRSSGKSALLAFIAHTIDPVKTVEAQLAAGMAKDQKEAGPAAGYSWNDVANVRCEVEWLSGEGTSGRVIYIPQNSLNALSEQNDEITKKITPALYRGYPELKTAHDSATNQILSANTEITEAINNWFELAERIRRTSEAVREVGDKAAITTKLDTLLSKIDQIPTQSALTNDAVTTYQAVTEQLAERNARLQEIPAELHQLSSFASRIDRESQPTPLPGSVMVNITVQPSPADLPDSVATRIDRLVDDAAKGLEAEIGKAFVDAVLALTAEEASLQRSVKQIRSEHADLISKHKLDETLNTLLADKDKQATHLAEISKLEASRDKLAEGQRAAVQKIEGAITRRAEALISFQKAFQSEQRVLTDLTFGIETGITTESVEQVSAGFNQACISGYIENRGDPVAWARAQADPQSFLEGLDSGSISLKKGHDARSVAIDVLTLTEDIRFSATLDSDHIGGFGRSSMTPGKKALFALTLILNESQEPWPLLIDQPEDDLDSRSIYDTIVPYLMKRKKERQIIMVSHNANMVIGSDSEVVIVANRHGDDRKNEGGRTFEYLGGSLEDSKPLNTSSPTALARGGIREHACEILDGGEQAFLKRRDKYKI